MSIFKKFTLTIVAAIACCGANTASAGDYHYGYAGHHYGQDYNIGGHPIFHGYHGYNWSYHRGNPFWYSGHEIADVIRSSAQANLLNAHARTQNEVARSARMDNSIKLLNTHLERRSINRTARFAHLWAQGAKARAEREAAAANQELAGVSKMKPTRLTESEINPATGRLTWPLLLEMEHYTKARKPVNQVFTNRAEAGKINPDHYLPLCDWVGKITAELDKNVHNYPEADYVEARDFLRRLVVEARLPITTTSNMMQLASK